MSVSNLFYPNNLTLYSGTNVTNEVQIGEGVNNLTITNDLSTPETVTTQQMYNVISGGGSGNLSGTLTSNYIPLASDVHTLVNSTVQDNSGVITTTNNTLDDSGTIICSALETNSLSVKSGVNIIVHNNIVPSTTDTYNLGGSLSRFNALHVNTVDANIINGAYNQLDNGSGDAVFLSNDNSLTAFQLQNSSGTPYFNANASTKGITTYNSTLDDGLGLMNIVAGTGNVNFKAYNDGNLECQIDGAGVKIDNLNALTGITTANNPLYVKLGTNNANAFQVLQSDNFSVFNVDTTAGVITSTNQTINDGAGNASVSSLTVGDNLTVNAGSSSFSGPNTSNFNNAAAGSGYATMEPLFEYEYVSVNVSGVPASSGISIPYPNSNTQATIRKMHAIAVVGSGTYAGTWTDNNFSVATSGAVSFYFEASTVILLTTDSTWMVTADPVTFYVWISATS